MITVDDRKQRLAKLTVEGQRILDIISDAPVSPEEISVLADIPVEKVKAELLSLEASGLLHSADAEGA